MNKQRHRPQKMRLKLFAALITFSLVTLLLLWGFQLLMLDTLYHQLTKNRMNDAADQIETLYNENDSLFLQRISALSLNNEFCIYVFDKSGNPIANAHPQNGCILHNINEEALTSLYETSLKYGGDYFHRADMENFQNEDGHSFLRSKYTVRDRVLSVKIKETDQGRLIIMFDAAISPVNVIKGALTVQLIVTTLLMLLIAGVIANALAKKLSQPISDVNRAAKKLTQGEYDVCFTGEGYREIHELSDTLNKTAKDLKKTDAIQKELIANISHDLRTPLTLITGYCEMMRDIEGENTPENMQVVLDETARLSSLVNDLVELSKYQNSEEKFESENIDIDSLLIETLDRYRKLMNDKEYVFTYESEGPVFANCDKKRILQVIYNLINNAINYSGDDKTVIVSLKATDTGRARVEITDHGEGIAKEDLPHIFDRYYKVDKVHKRAVTGTGLGLSIVKGILEKHGAAYGVRSELGVGSTFYFEI